MAEWIQSKLLYFVSGLSLMRENHRCLRDDRRKQDRTPTKEEAFLQKTIHASVAEWSIAGDCKSPGLSLRWFKSNPAHFETKSQTSCLAFSFDSGHGFEICRLF